MSHDPGPGLPPGPPWSVDTLADIHAGVYPPAMTSILRHQIAMDPEATAVLAALDELTGDLHELDPMSSDPKSGNTAVPAMPTGLAERLEAAMAAEVNARFAERRTQPSWPAQRAAAPQPARSESVSFGTPPPTGPSEIPPPPWQAGASVISLDAARTAAGRKRRTTWIAAIGGVAAAAVIGTVVVVGLGSGSSTDGASSAAPQVQRSSSAAEQQGDAAAAEPQDNSEPEDNSGGGAGATAPAPAPTSASTSTTSAAASSSAASSSAGSSSAGTTTRSQDPPGAAFEADVLVLDPEDLPSSYNDIVGRNVTVTPEGDSEVTLSEMLGELADPEVLQTCLFLNGIRDQQLVGLRTAEYSGQSGYALAFVAFDDPTAATILVVGPDCGTDGSDVLDRTTFTL